MPTKVSQYLSTLGFHKKKNVQEIVTVLAGWNILELGNFCLEVSSRLPRITGLRDSTFSFIGSASLAGYPSPCSNPSCRLESVDSMARFATLYANEVILPDPFGEIHEGLDHVEEESKIYACIDIAVHLAALRLLEPVLDEGLISYADTMHHHLCTGCYAKAIGEVESKYSAKLVSIRKLIKEKLLSGTSIEVTQVSDDITYHLRGPDTLLPHGGHLFTSRNVPKAFRSRDLKIPFMLTRREISTYHVLDREIGEIIEDILRQNWYSNQSGVNYLTHREIDLEAIRQFEAGSGRRKVTSLSPTIFSHSVPIVGEVALNRIVKLRRTEAGAFELYRDAVSKSLQRHRVITLKEQIQLFNDVVRPEIAKIDAAVRRSRKLLMKSIAQDLVVASGAVGIGLFSGLLPHAIGAAAVGLGSLHYSPQFVRKLTELCSEPKPAAESRYYFLWKMKRAGGRHIDMV